MYVNTTLSSFLSAINLIIYDQHLMDFYGKIEHFVEVFANDFQTILWLFKNPFMHYVRYQGKSILASKGAPDE